LLTILILLCSLSPVGCCQLISGATLIIFNRFWSDDHFVALGFFTEQTAVNLSTFAS
jgi:hypothetical protein